MSTSAVDTGAGSADAASLISDARQRIDDLDQRIIGLLAERVTVSEQIQRERIASGGRRVHLSREMEVINRYNGELGRQGTALAMTVLALCRGQL
ncbi:chorismate mutase [Streptomyces sp. RPT161]|uniref:chorismate mutase n=1 Tax=Streptomyces sp. RPT161 TaxID=3015993 RepID=UPI0022B8F431|nr:chorismate mutase [Streptomyces sp. RPT161]